MKHLTTGLTALSRAAQLCLLAAAFGTSAGVAAADTTRVIVAFKPGVTAQARAAIEAARGAVRLELPAQHAVAVELPAAAVAALRRQAHFAYVEEDVRRYPLALTSPSKTPYLHGQRVPYGIAMVQADQLPDTQAANRKLCIIDSGIDRAHEDLRTVPADGIHDTGTGWWNTDENAHGTHVAGTIAALNNAGTGVVGVAPNGRLKLHIVKVFSADGWAYSSTLAKAAQQCGDAGAHVISMSLGGGLPSQTEIRTFQALALKGVLSVAAAGNNGNSAVSYPAGYPSVMMVGAVDEHRQWAGFSQFNHQMELAAPGVEVLSTVPMRSGSEPALTVARVTYSPGSMSGSPQRSASGALADFGLGDKVNPAVAGKVCLIARGNIDFATKVGNCQNSGGVGAVVYNNVAGGFGGTLGAAVTVIPSVTASDTEGARLKTQLGQAATVTVTPVHYAYFDGTSMATPHVAAVAALVWSYFPRCSASQIRASLNKSALDLGSAGWDDKFGHGLVQAKAAHDRIAAKGCGI
ncbi:S8 family serine peptidase [Massilia sp. PAMC28688]|uniref:S8 family serine peptidase n=1 Tax=Massilia sp. PAMC28688 TaxID=2861283 RepID=UPI001C633890|nr:S8 family serine peptidase [Massilia sp. PAMC28688]QYF94486.1 S8 family serine peptidase [Massilia sp. PAMC28688]